MEEALALRAAAKKKTHSVSALFSKLGGSKKSSTDAAEAEELYTRSANLFLGQRQFSEAADSFVRAASVAPSVYSAASLNVEAAKAWRSANEPQFAAKYYAEAIALFARHGPLRRAALVCTELAQLYDEAKQYQLSLKTWNRAAELYDDQHDGPHAAQARLGAADVAARVGDFLQAIERYEAAAEECAKDTLTRFKLKQYFLRSGLCYLAEGDTVGLDKALAEKYTRWDRAFSGTIEYRLLVELRTALIDRDVPRFEQAMYNYDTKHRLGKWELEVALKVKDRFTLPPEDEIL